ncbi:MAG: DUF2505 domain-containing protein [Acidimicrobiales bacterium]|jgi:hypothetical protein
MKLKGSHAYDAPLEAVLAVLGDESATIAKYESMGHRDVKVVENERGDGSLRVVSSRVVDVDLPGFAKRVLRPTNTMRQTDTWTRATDDSWEGTFDVEVQGAPIHISGSMILTASDGKTVHDVDLRVDVKVPIIGGRIADWAGKGDVRRSLDGEFSFNARRLREHPFVPAPSTKRAPRRA